MNVQEKNNLDLQLSEHKKIVFKSIDELPISMSIEQMGSVLGVSRSTAYELANSKGFPVIRVGKRMIVSKQALMKWMEEQSQLGA